MHLFLHVTYGYVGPGSGLGLGFGFQAEFQAHSNRVIGFRLEFFGVLTIISSHGTGTTRGGSHGIPRIHPMRKPYESYLV